MDKKRIEEKAKLWCQIVHLGMDRFNKKRKRFERERMIDRLDKYGLKKEEDAKYFLQVLADHGINISSVASDIASKFDISSIITKKDASINIRKEVSNGFVQLIEYRSNMLDGRFVLGVSGQTSILVAKAGLDFEHLDLVDEYLSCFIIEGGFLKVSHYSKTMILHGMIEAFQLEYGSFAFSMLREAFPDYQIVAG